MDNPGSARRVRIYVGESDQSRGRPLHLALLELLRSEGCAGATVIRGIASFGASSRIHTAAVLRLSEDLPVVIDWIDSPDRVERILPKVLDLVEGGLVTVEDVRVAHYRHRPVSDIGARVRVGEVMSREVASVGPDVSLRDAADLLLRRRLRALPVVDRSGRVVGILTGGDLVERGGLRVRVELLRQLDQDALSGELRAVEEGRIVADVMSRDVVTASPDATLSDAAHLMVARRLKRMPVVDAAVRLLGMVSRVDLLRTASGVLADLPTESLPRSGRTIGDIARSDLPTLSRDAPLAEVLDAVVSTRLNQAIVLDEAGQVLGIVSDEELVRRLSSRDHPSVARILMSRLPFARLSAEERREVERAVGITAESLMVPSVATARADTPVPDAVAAMLRERRKLLPVVDAGGVFVGAVDRADLLRTLLIDRPVDQAGYAGGENESEEKGDV